MMIRRYLFVLLAGCLLASCEPEVDEFSPDYTVPIPRGSILNFYQLAPAQTDTIYALQGVTGSSIQVRSKTGVILEIPDSAWVTSGGKVVTDGYQLEWKEIRTLLDQVSDQLSMRDYQGRIQTDIAWSLTAEKEGESLVLQRDILMRWPSVSGGSLQVYNGTRPTPWVFRWQKDPQGQFSLTNWIDPVNGAGVNGYLVAVQAAGIGCLGEETTLSTADPEIQVQMPKGFSEANTSVYWLDKVKNQCFALDYEGDGIFLLEDVPAGQSGRLFCVTEAVQNNFYATWKDVTLDAGGYTWTPIPEKISLGLVWTMLETL